MLSCWKGTQQQEQRSAFRLHSRQEVREEKMNEEWKVKEEEHDLRRRRKRRGGET